MDQLTTCEISKNLHPKWGKLLWLKEISKKNFDPESARHAHQQGLG
jgi:hypothetical protein